VAEKQFKPTARRLREARKRGQVVFSNDVASTLVFVVVVLGLWLFGSTALSMLQELWLQATSRAALTRPDARFTLLLWHSAEVILWLCIGIFAIAALGGLAGSFFQVGGLAAWQRMKPDANRLNPAEGFKRVFSVRSLVNLLKMVLKTLLLAAVVYLVVRTYLADALRLGYVTPATTMSVVGEVLLVTCGWAAVVYAAMAGIDYVHEHFEFMQQQRMSFEDLQREHKESEGDPVNRSRRRSAYFEIVYASIGDRVRASSAVIHAGDLAIALQYRGEHDLPRVIARGEGEVAQQIRRVATEQLIPTEEGPELARRLYAEVPLDQPIPQSLYAPVARLLRWAQGEDQPSPTNERKEGNEHG
jgi:type III secretion protein U